MHSIAVKVQLNKNLLFLKSRTSKKNNAEHVNGQHVSMPLLYLPDNHLARPVSVLSASGQTGEVVARWTLALSISLLTGRHGASGRPAQAFSCGRDREGGGEDNNLNFRMLYVQQLLEFHVFTIVEPSHNLMAV